MDSSKLDHEESTIQRMRTFRSTAESAVPIRRATVEDCEAIFHAHKASVTGLCSRHYTADQLQAWLGQQQLTDYKTAVQNALVLVAEKGGGIIGFAQMDLGAGLIWALYVHPDHIGQGLGTTLLAALEKEARASGLQRIHLNATLNSVAFWQARGFLPLRDGSNTLSDGTRLPCAHMEKVL